MKNQTSIAIVKNATCEANIQKITAGIPNVKADIVIEALKNNYTALVEEGEVILVLVDENMKIDFISSTICDALGYAENTLINKNISVFAQKESYETIKKGIKTITEQNLKVYKVPNLTLVCAYDYEHYYDGIIINLKDTPNVNGYLLYLHNVTKRHKIADQLKDLNLELDSFVYKASHDLRAPLTSLAGLINLTELDFPKEAKENFELMKRSVLKLDKFIQQLSHYARNNNTEAELSEINPTIFVQEVIDSYKHFSNTEKIYFDIIDKTTTKITSDAFRIRVILSNLISNAIKYHQVRQALPYISVEISNDNIFYIFKVEDNGVGIHPEYQNRIFEMFVRASNYGDGSGLGLYIVKKALEKLNGAIQLQTELGAGSTFTVKIPIQQQITHKTEVL